MPAAGTITPDLVHRRETVTRALPQQRQIPRRRLGDRAQLPHPLLRDPQPQRQLQHHRPLRHPHVRVDRVDLRMLTSELDRLHHPLRLTGRIPVPIHLRTRHIIEKNTQHITRRPRTRAELLIDDHPTSIEQSFEPVFHLHHGRSCPGHEAADFQPAPIRRR